MRYTKVAILFISMLLCSCSKSYLQDGDSSLNGDKDFISLNVTAQDAAVASSPASTKALIEDYYALRAACTPQGTGEKETIGLFGSYTLNGSTTHIYNNGDLWWWEKENGNLTYDQAGERNHWNYPGENIPWVDDAEYTFKAYFPKSQVYLQPGSGPDQLLVVYDSQTEQYDLMVAHRKLMSGAEYPVNLKLEHALAALKVDFRFVSDGASDNLTAFWFENASENGFYTRSTLNYSQEVIWPVSTSDPVGTPLYYWEPETPLHIQGQQPVAVYSTEALPDRGGQYTTNDSWLLVIPQSSQNSGTVKMCFTTTIGGNTVYTLPLPAFNFQPGKRYTYHVKMSVTGIDLGLTISDWNERKSSYDVDFNE